MKTNKFRTNISFAIIFLCLALFILLCALQERGSLKIDTSAVDFVLDLRRGWLNKIVKLVTHVGSFYVLLVVALLVAIFNKKVGFVSVFGLGVSGVLNFIVKHIIERPRPDIKLIAETGFSFPSGHAMMSITLYGFLLYAVIVNINKTWLKSLLATLLVGMIAVSGLSRVYLGVHYLSDVIAGYALGLAILVPIIYSFKNLNFGDFKLKK
ncbi:MAG: phosphatase PAP2 family protein [Clostridiales bacterium]|nr:phosphatase PAP2 family protein [Clostridiales bacterium]